MKIDTRYDIIVHADTRQGGRSENQDTCAYADTKYGFLITVCDGMGGGPSGKLASMTAADAIINHIKTTTAAVDIKELIVSAVRAGDDAIRAAVMENPEHAGMGTTVTLLLINDRSAFVAHVGDSRVYQLREKKKLFRTNDHSFVFGLVEDGQLTEEEARVHPRSNVIMKALGANIQYSEGEQLDVDVKELSYDAGDRFMLCTDGIWGAFPEQNIVSMATTPRNVAGAVENLIVRVDEYGFDTGGGHDNLTVAIVQPNRYSKLRSKMSKRTKRLILFLSLLLALSLICNIVQLCNNGSTDSLSNGKQTTNLDSLVEQKVKQTVDNMKSKDSDEIDIDKNIKEILSETKEQNNKETDKDKDGNKQSSQDSKQDKEQPKAADTEKVDKETKKESASSNDTKKETVATKDTKKESVAESRKESSSTSDNNKTDKSKQNK